jgi:hypothetical protein
MTHQRSSPTSPITGRDLTWNVGPSAQNGLRDTIVWAIATSTLPSGTVITMHCSVSSSNWTAAGTTFTCAGTITAGTTGTNTGTTNAWTGASLVQASTDLMVVAAANWTSAGGGQTADASSTEDNDYTSPSGAADKEVVIEHRLDAGTHTLGGTWGNGGSGWAAASMIFTETAAGARPDADVTDGSWLNELGTNTNLFASIDESAANDSDYIQSSLSPSTADVVEINLSDITP